jgi:hypothetical protein
MRTEQSSYREMAFRTRRFVRGCVGYKRLVEIPKHWVVERTHAWNEYARSLIMHHDWFFDVSPHSPLGCSVAQRTKPASAPHPLWERACPRSKRLGGWHRLRRCSRGKPAPTDALLIQGVSVCSIGVQPKCGWPRLVCLFAVLLRQIAIVIVNLPGAFRVVALYARIGLMRHGCNPQDA